VIPEGDLQPHLAESMHHKLRYSERLYLGRFFFKVYKTVMSSIPFHLKATIYFYPFPDIHLTSEERSCS